MISVLYQAADFWVVVKPAGESFHSEAGIGFFQRLCEAFPGVSFYPVHRLDKMTSGLLLVACNKDVARELMNAFSEKIIEKRYLAISSKKPKKKQGTIKGNMAPGRNGQWKLSSEGKMAVTQFHSCFVDGRRAFYIRPRTGRTHQIRVALKSVGAPILGDSRYGGEASDRGYLHAYKLSFKLGDLAYDFSILPSEGAHFSSNVLSVIEEVFCERKLIWPRT
ncbi:pseudouridine synthase [Marinomonas balearica]|uniref:tRNA pseudouridine32 synthase/23S rRNA pseudouridine746 synthase n=1 Tax=Marinomonas balearica TaxID=491947 RepID=A0A4R6MF05_9GAMM|nr:pseudouridine synthase [Marinomonas balearica]TDO99865.1 tRNA pseudouridine32 synthase/23S rRNA pseudouridine746 synthase [Marinomonas balearica]